MGDRSAEAIERCYYIAADGGPRSKPGRWHSRPECTGLYLAKVTPVQAQECGVSTDPDNECRLCRRATNARPRP